MKWIKGKPKAEDIDKVIMRRISNKLFVITQVYEYDSVQLDTSIETVLWEDVEWLDESDQFTPPVSNEASHTPVKVYSREQMESAIEHFSKYVEKYGFIPSTELVNMYLSGIKNSLISVREINHLLSSLPTPSTDEWVDVRERLPDDGEKVYFNSHTYGNVSIGFFYKIDSFNRENMFISTDGAHFPLNDVSHWMLRHIPTPPQ